MTTDDWKAGYIEGWEAFRRHMIARVMMRSPPDFDAAQKLLAVPEPQPPNESPLSVE
jgi:hypothetical protein